MKFRIFEKKYNYIGLHLNAHAIKAMQFAFAGNRTTVKAFVNAPMAKGLMQADEFIDSTKLAEFLKSSLSRPQHGSFNTKRVVASIPESKSFVRVIEVPLMEESKAEVAVMFEAEAYIPMPMDQVYFDWQILSKDTKTMEVLIIASPKEYVDRFMSIIESAGLKLCGIEVESQSVSRALVPAGVEEPVMIVDLDAEQTALVVVEKAVLQFTSSVPLSGSSFTEAIAKELKITPDKAEKLKREVGFANTVEYPNVKTALMPIVEDLASEVRNILKYHYERSDERVEKVLLTSGGAKLRHITEALQPLLEEYAPIEVIVANPLEHVPNLQHSPLTPYEALSFTTCIGLALWERDIQ